MHLQQGRSHRRSSKCSCCSHPMRRPLLHQRQLTSVLCSRRSGSPARRRMRLSACRRMCSPSCSGACENQRQQGQPAEGWRQEQTMTPSAWTVMTGGQAVVSRPPSHVAT